MRKIKSLAGLMIMSMAMVLGMASMNAEAAKKKGAGTITNNVKVVMDYEDNETNPVPIEGTKVSIKGGLLGTKFLLGDKYYECDENGKVSFKQTSRITNMYFELPKEWKDKVTVDKVLYNAKLAGTFKYKNYSVESKDISNNGFRIGMPLAWTKVDTTIHFKPKKFKVMFDTQGAGDVQTQEVDYLRQATKPEDPEREGYTFEGWYLGDEKFDFANTGITKDTELTAKWKIKKYTVSFISGVEGITVESQEVEHGSKVSKPETEFVKEGYTFKGWYRSGQKFSFDTEIKENITLTAEWAINEYTVKFDSAEGTAIEEKVVEHGKKVEKPNVPIKAGHTFVGWYLGEEEFDFDTAITRNITLTAHWKKNIYTVTFVNDEEVVTTAKVPYGEKVSVPETPIKEAYLLKGWYNGEVKFDFESDVVTENINLTAKWERNPEYDAKKVLFFIYNAPDVKWDSIWSWAKKVMSHDETYFIPLGEKEAYLSKVSVFKDQWKKDFASYDVIENPAIPGNDVAFYNSSNQPIADVTGLLTDQIKNQMHDKYKNHTKAEVRIYRLTQCDDGIHVDLALYDTEKAEWIHNQK